MRQTIIAQKISLEDSFCLGIIVETINEESNIDVISALRNAAKDFANTKEGQEALEETYYGCINWGDLVEYLPEEVCVRHGVRIIDTFQTDLVVTHDELLAYEQ